MALYHFSVTQIRRSAGSSAVASAAYRAGERLHSDRYDEINDYTKKGGVLFTDILLPPHAPPELKDREKLWNAVEAAEKRADAQLAYSFDFALQNEFTYEENLELARRFITENFISRGMIADYAVHDPDRGPGGISNPHVHVMCPIRPLKPDGSWGEKQTRIPVLDEKGSRVWDEKNRRWKFNAVPATDWGAPETLETWRANWCGLCNAMFAAKGMNERIDHRSYKRQGLELLAQVHEGPAVRSMERKGIPTEKGDYNRWVKAANAALKSIREKLAELVRWIKEAGEELEKQETPILKEILLNYMQLQNDGTQSFSNYGRQKAKLVTLKDVSSAIAYLDENHIENAEQLEVRLSSLTASLDRHMASMKDKTGRMKKLKEAIGQVKIYQENLSVFQEMGKPKYRFKKAKAAYQEQHEGALKLFYRARRVMKEAGMPDHYDPAMLQAWKTELAQLETEYSAEYGQLKPLREEQRKLSHIRYCTDWVLKEKNREKHQTKDQEMQKGLPAEKRENAEITI